MTVVDSPDITNVVDQSFFQRPLGGPVSPLNYLDRFPDELYNKGIDSHLVKFLYALLGPSGTAWLRKNYLQARLQLEDYGIDTFDLDGFYGDPLSFGRILEETYDQDPEGLLSNDEWQAIRAKDASYRNRAVDYVNGARAGNTPLGMRLVARSGLGHEVEIVENYRYLYDQLSDDQLGIQYDGQTRSTEEMIVIPRRELPQNEVQTLSISGSPTGGTFDLFFPVANEDAATVIIHSNANAAMGDTETVGGAWENIQAALEQLPSIGQNNVKVTGGPLPDQPVYITFTGDLAYEDLPEFQTTNNLTGGTLPVITVSTSQLAIDQTDEVVSIPPRDQRYLSVAMSHIKPVTTILTYGKSPNLQSTQVWNSVLSTSAYSEVIRFVTGKSSVPWTPKDAVHWIEGSAEHQAPRSLDDLNHHYRGFHNVISVKASGSQVGAFSQYQISLYPTLASSNGSLPDFVLADYAEPLLVGASSKGVQLINGIYPMDYATLPGVDQIKYTNDQFWSSAEKAEGDDYLELDLGTPQAVNYLYFETTRKPYDIHIEYDILDQDPDRDYRPVTFQSDIPASTQVGFDAGSSNPWQIFEFYFDNNLGQTIFTRFIRITFSRRLDLNSPFVDNLDNKLPYSIDIRNLRIARNIS